LASHSSPAPRLLKMNYKQVEIEDSTVSDGQAIRRAYKRFAIRHGLLPEEVGQQESRTMSYKTDFPNKKKDIAEARKRYGDPKKWIRWAAEQQGVEIEIKDFL
jgi:hypothetical protein